MIHIPFVHAGELWLVSSPPEPPSASGPVRDGARKAQVSLRVLIVEDEFFIALDMEALVESLGHSVVGFASSADEAVASVGQDKPDIVFMDIRLSGVRDGIDAATEIRSRYGVPILFVTANTDPSTLQRAKAVGPIGVLEKPLTRPRLEEQLSRFGRE
jgi:two-component system, response regulator PdtaR